MAIDFDLEKGHRHFSAACFNLAWKYIDKKERTPEEELAMLEASMASLWHWQQRPDCTQGNLSIGYWQLSRIYVLRKQPDAARNYGQLCLKASQGEGTQPFHLAYAYEALARAAGLAGDLEARDGFLKQAREASERMADPEDRKNLLEDLKTI